MGWSIDLAREDIDTLFSNMGKQYRLTHVGAETPMVMIQYEGEMDTKVKRTIVNLFPEFVYIEFVPNSTFPVGSSISRTEVGTGLAETH